jgi:hypothetical protein
MKNIIAKLMLVAFAAVGTLSLNADDSVCYNGTLDIPRIESLDNWTRVSDVVQNASCGWDNSIGITRGISLEEAKEIADNDPAITFFFYVKVPLNIAACPKAGLCECFHESLLPGDTVFFTGEPDWLELQGAADGYIKKQ